MNCILRVIKGPDTGASCRLLPGVNLVGRSPKAALKLTPPDISWEHLSITRNGDQYIAENLSALGTYIDDVKITAPLRLEPRQQLRLSKDTVVRFEAGPDEERGALAGRAGWMLIILLVLGAIGFIFWSMNADTSAANWEGAYSRIQRWADRQADLKRLDPQVPMMFQNAWRLERTEDYTSSRAAWLRLKMVLGTLDPKMLPPETPQHVRVLSDLLDSSIGPSVELSDEAMAAALQQFVARRLTWATFQSKRT